MLDCVVAGAGIAGLVAANELTKRGKDVLVLEARDRVGGRVENRTLSDGTVLELGGQWISPGHERMVALIDRYGLERCGPVEGDLMVWMDGRATRVRVSDDVEHRLSPFEVADLGQGLLRFRRLAGRLSHDPAWSQANATWLDQDLMRWVASNLRTWGGQDQFAQVFARVYNVPAESATLRQGLELSSGGVDMESLVAVNGGLNQFRIQGGIGRLCAAMAAELGERIRLSSPVHKVERAEDSVSVSTPDGQTIQARTAILTLPPHLSVVLDHQPPLPGWRLENATKVPPGNVIKAFLVYPEPWWRTQGLSGQMGADAGAVRVTFDVSPAQGPGVLMGFFEGAEASSLGVRSASLRHRGFEDAVAAVFGDHAQEATEYIERDWLAEPYTRGCHGAHFAPGVWTAAGSRLAEPEGRVCFAGSEYASRFNGYLEGAVLSATEAVQQVLHQV